MRDGERSDREGVGVREALVSLPHPGRKGWRKREWTEEREIE